MASTLIRKQAGMGYQALNRRELRDQAKPGRAPPVPARTGIETARVSSPQRETGWCAFRSAHLLVHEQLVTEETVITLVESEEVLIVDPRGTLTPSQMVDQKLRALLGSCPRSLH